MARLVGLLIILLLAAPVGANAGSLRPSEKDEALNFLASLSDYQNIDDVPGLPSEDGWYEYLAAASLKYDKTKEGVVLDLLRRSYDLGNAGTQLIILNYAFADLLLLEDLISDEALELRAEIKKIISKLAENSKDHANLFRVALQFVSKGCADLDFFDAFEVYGRTETAFPGILIALKVAECDWRGHSMRSAINKLYLQTGFVAGRHSLVHKAATQTYSGTELALLVRLNDLRRSLTDTVYTTNFDQDLFDADLDFVEGDLPDYMAGLYEFCDASMSVFKRFFCIGFVPIHHPNCLLTGRNGRFLNIKGSELYRTCRHVQLEQIMQDAE